MGVFLRKTIDKLFFLRYNYKVNNFMYEREKIMDDRVFVMNHPLIQHKLTIMRDKNTSVKDFRECAHEIGLLLGYEATKGMELEDFEIETPITKTIGKRTKLGVALVPILRAGLGMVDALMDLIPSAKIGHIGLYRNEETLEPVEYYCKVPTDIEQRQVLVLDPMLATGGSAVDAITLLKRRGAKNIKFVCIIAAPVGVEALRKAHPDVDIYCGAVDEKLNEKGYIVPGLGDAGDRLFGTL